MGVGLDAAWAYRFSATIGDVIYDGGLIDDGIPGTNKAQYETSMQRRLTLDLSTVLPGHGPTLSGEQAHTIATDYLATATHRPNH